MLEKIKHSIPHNVRESLRQLPHFYKKPELHYLELHLTDHCNMSCKGCDHFCPIAPKHFADLNQHEKEMKRLKQLFRNIRMIRLMGGEPLLHRDVVQFIRITRSVFPKTDLRVVTNGLLLPKASQTFWQACRDTNTTIDISLYPPLQDNLPDYRRLCDDEGVSLSVTYRENFVSHMNLNGDSGGEETFKACRKRYFHPFLQNGRVYTCGMAALVHHFNNKFDYRITPDEGIDIYSPATTGKKILKKLNRPIDTCKWCSYDFVPHPWQPSNRVPEEWNADVHREGASP